MIKKLLSIVAALILICATFKVSANSAEVKVKISGSMISVSITCADYGTKTMKVFKVDDSAAEETLGNVVHFSETENYKLDKDAYVYYFEPFQMKSMAEKGLYRVIISNNYAADFYYISNADRVDIYNEIAAANEEEIGQCIKKNINYLQFELTDILNDEDVYEKQIYKSLADLRLPHLSRDPVSSDEEIAGYEKIFADEIMRLKEICFLLNEREDVLAVLKSSKYLDIDRKFIDDEKLKLSSASVTKRMNQQQIPDSFENASIKKMVDTAVLLAIIDSGSDGYISEALNYYNGSCIQIENDSNLTGSQKNLISRELRNNAEKMKNSAAIEAAYAEAKSSIESKTTGGAGGGRGSTGVGAPRISKSENNDINMTQPLFSDISDAEWAAEAIEFLAKRNVINGKSKNMFCPNDSITREEAVKIIVNSFGLYDENLVCEFIDVEPERWSNAFIASAVKNGIVMGVTDCEFAPEEKITRQDMCVIIYRLLTAKKIASTDSIALFDDMNSVADYAKTAVKELKSLKIIDGRGSNIFEPMGTLTRAESAQLIFKTVKLMEDNR